MDRILAIRQICKSRTACPGISKQQLNTSIRLLSNKNDSSSSDSSDSDNEKKQRKHTKKVVVQPDRDEASKKQTADLLKDLLMKMSQKPPVTKTIDLSVPKKKPFPKPPVLPTLEEKIVVAAKDVAASLGGDVEKKESDLIKKVFSAGTPEPQAEMKQGLKKTEQQSPLSMSDLLSEMKIDRTRKPVTAPGDYRLSRSARVQELAKKFQSRQPNGKMNEFKKRSIGVKEEPARLYEGRRLDIFNSDLKTEDSPIIPTWETLKQKELKMLVNCPPDNIYQELIHWTNQGMLWKFPIDNEQGMESEDDVHFSEHVFLEPHLEGWCPKKGPIRHFMELVCVGLSKNPYMTVEEKKEHILWFKDYFGENQELLKELNAIQQDILPEKTERNLFAITA